MTERRYWIGVASHDHVEAAVMHGFVQFRHGNGAPLERMRPGDGFAYYSPRRAYRAGAQLQAFTAIGRISDGAIYTADPRTDRPANASADAAQDAPGDAAASEPAFRRNAAYFDASPTPIKPLLERLSFIRSKTHWGAALRFGLVRISRDDFATIATAMGRDVNVDFA